MAKKSSKAPVLRVMLGDEELFSEECDATPSASGKTVVIASTRGNKATGVEYNGKEVTLGLNVYFYPSEKGSKKKTNKEENGKAKSKKKAAAEEEDDDEDEEEDDDDDEE